MHIKASNSSLWMQLSSRYLSHNWVGLAQMAQYTAVCHSSALALHARVVPVVLGSTGSTWEHGSSGIARIKAQEIAKGPGRVSGRGHGTMASPDNVRLRWLT